MARPNPDMLGWGLARDAGRALKRGRRRMDRAEEIAEGGQDSVREERTEGKQPAGLAGGINKKKAKQRRDARREFERTGRRPKVSDYNK